MKKNDRESVKKVFNSLSKQRVVEIALDYREGYFALLAKHPAKRKMARSNKRKKGIG